MSTQKIKLSFYTIFAIVLFLLAGLLFRVGTSNENIGDSMGGIHEVVLGDVVIPVERADTVEKRQQGLSGREKLPDGAGMLFVFPESYTYGFWMKDMLFALDMLWFDSNGCIIDIHEDVSPDTYPTIFKPKEPAQFVLEMAANFVAENDITVGTCASFNNS